VNTFALDICVDEASKCTFYSVRWEVSEHNETDKFFNKYDSIAEFKRSAQELLSFILDNIGEDHGAVDMLFIRFENEVVGLPNKGKVTIGEISFLFPNFPLRLYALRINNRPDLVILFNGGIKSAQTNQQSKNLNLKWIEACQFAKRIEEAIRDKEIINDEKNRRILSGDGSDEILL
jgi:hypothetical protein